MATFTPVFTALAHNAIAQPERRVLAYADEHGKLERTLTWRQLADQTDTLCGYLRTEHGLAVGDRVLLVYPPSLDFVIAFAACLRAGLIPVPVYPPNPRKFDSGMEAFLRIAHDCDAQLVLTSTHYERSRNRGGVEALAAAAPEQWAMTLSWVTTDTLEPGRYAPVYGPAAAPDDVALIQYTSGSTSAPKGVVITQRNLAHQVDYTRRAMRLDDTSKAVFWVPQYHDLGLIGGIMTALAGHVELTLFSPFAFIKRPALWFDLIHQLRATHTAGPNFAFDLVLQKTTPEQRAAWDLSSLQVVMSAAEPVRAQTLQRFVTAFAPAQLDATAYLPAYGLAEHTVGVSFNGGSIKTFARSALEHHSDVVEVPADQEDAIALVSSGRWDRDIDLRIVNTETHTECMPHQVGEIWVDSPSKAAGYWNLPDKNLEDFQATLIGCGRGSYLRTGDLGFIYGGELYICGRMKDVLIMGGRNLYPQDIEDTVDQLAHELKPVAAAAFTVDIANAQSVEEKLVLLIDIRKLKASQEQLQDLAQQLQREILAQHQIACHAIVIAPIGTVLKTTSGKVRRQACRQRWLDGSLAERALYTLQQAVREDQSTDRIVPPTELTLATRQRLLQELSAEQLNLPDAAAIDIEQSLIDQGMSSMAAISLCERYSALTGEDCSVTAFFNAPSIAQLSLSLGQAKLPRLSLDETLQRQQDPVTIELHALRHYLRHNRYSRTGFRLGSWAVRPATQADVPALHQLDQQEYGWLGDDATDSADLIAHQVQCLNSNGTPWFWVLEKRTTNPASDAIEATLVGWYIMQPTLMESTDITAWAQATDDGRLTRTFNPGGRNLYLVAAGISREHTKQAHRLMVLNALSLMAVHGISTLTACLAMPGYAEAHTTSGISPDEYIALTDQHGRPKDAFLNFFRELWPAHHRPMRLLRNGYPPDQFSAGHGVCVCVEATDYITALDEIMNSIHHQRAALFDQLHSTSPDSHVTPRATDTSEVTL